MPNHSTLTAIHRAENFSFVNAAGRIANGIYAMADIGKLAFQQDDKSYWRLDNVTNPGATATPTWTNVGGAGTNISRIENGYLITSLSGAEGTSLKNKDVTGLSFGYKIVVTLNDSDQFFTYQNGAPVAATGDVAVTTNANVRWRKTSGY